MNANLVVLLAARSAATVYWRKLNLITEICKPFIVF